MADFEWDDDDRQRWEDEAAAALLVLAVGLRKRMAGKIGTTLPTDPGAVWQASWWTAGLDGPVRDEYERIAAEAAGTFHAGAGWGPIPDVLKATVATGAATSIITAMGGRGDVVERRVADLILEGTTTNETGTADRNGEWLATQLELGDGAGGPLSDELMSDYGKSATNTLYEGAANGVMDAYGVTSEREWHCAFVPASRLTHEDADGQISVGGEPFDIGGYPADFPGDPELPVEESIGCLCWLTYTGLPDSVTSEDGGDGVPSDDVSDESFSLRHHTAAMTVERVRRFAEVLADVPPVVDVVPVDAVPVDPGSEPPDYTDGVAITVEPTAAEKAMLAVPGGLAAADLHVTLAYLGTTAEMDEATRLTVGSVLAQVAETEPPFGGSVAGIGWFGAADQITLALIDGDGLAALRTVIVDLLIAAGIDIATDHDLIPHCTLGYGQFDAADKVGMPLHFNELRLRFGAETLVFDLMGPMDAAPEPEVVIPETAPVAPDAPPVEAPMTVTDVPFADLPGDVPMEPDAGMPPADLSAVPDDILTAELARRAADQALAETAAATGVEPTADQAAAATAAAEMEAAEIMDDLTDAVEVALGVVDPDAEPGEIPDPEDTVMAAALRDAMASAAAKGQPLIMRGPRTSFPSIRMQPFADLTAVTDGELAAELARRAAERAVTEVTADGYTPTPEEIAAAQEETIAEAAEVLIDLVDTAADVLVGDGGDEGEDGMMPTEPVDVPFAVSRETANGMKEAMILGHRHGNAFASTGAGTVTVMDATIPGGNTGVPFAVDGIPKPAQGITYDLTGILCVEGIMSGDGRMIAEGACQWRQLPIPFAFLDKITEQHQEGEFAGWIHEVWRDGAAIWGNITLEDNDAANRLRQYLANPKGAGRFGCSVDMTDVSAVYADPDGAILDPMEAQDAWYAGESVVEMMVSATLGGTTGVMHPAFQEANVWLIDSAPQDAAIIASGAPAVKWSTYRSNTLTAYGADMTAIVASAGGGAVPAPSKDLFALRPMETPEPFVVGAPLPDGTVPCYGLLAEKGTFHIGNARKRIAVPMSDDFRSFYTGKRVLTAEGELLPVGPIIMDTVHPNLMWDASDTQAFYAHTGCMTANVRLYRNEWGIVAAGVLSPDATPAQVRRLRASDVSPDWRPIEDESGRKEHKIVAVLAVPVSGFLVEGIAASAGRFQPWAGFDANGDMMGLVAAGALHRDHPHAVADEVAALRLELNETRAHLSALSDYVTDVGATLNRDAAVKAMAALGLDGPLRRSRQRAAAKALRTLGIPAGTVMTVEDPST